MKLIFATHNENKVAEVRRRIGPLFDLKSLSDMNWVEDIPETAPTLKGNAVLKAEAIYRATGINTFADDTGLEIDGLDGRPGVYSARYAGPAKQSEANMDKVLQEMAFMTNRTARFKTCICLIVAGEPYVFEGVVEGRISFERSGSKGFGYDPIFVPKGEDRTFAEMSMEEKNRISHRARAMDKLLHFLYKLL